MSKTSVLWIALVAAVGFGMLMVCVVVAVGIVWVMKPAPRMVVVAPPPEAYLAPADDPSAAPLPYARPTGSLLPANMPRTSAPVNDAAAPINSTPAPTNRAPLNEPRPANGQANAQVTLQTYRFPDGTGTVGLAPGWTTNAQSCQNGFQVAGPDGQRITLGFAIAVNTPDSSAAQLVRQFGSNGSAMMIANFADPATVLQALVPQLSAYQTQNGGPAVSIDHVATIKEMPPLSPAGKNALLTYGVTHVAGGQSQHFQALAQVSVTPMSNDSFMFWTLECLAPDASAKQDMPVMLAIANSWKANQAALQRNNNQTQANSRAAFEAGQAAHRDLVDSFDRYNAAQADNSVRQARSVDDFVETIRGQRDVQDTRTGAMAPVDLGNVDNTVNRLNEGDPGRYVQVPLRDQQDPLPAGR